MMRRRKFLTRMASTAMAASIPFPNLIGAQLKQTEFLPSLPGEDVFAYLNRTRQKFDLPAYKRILGTANEFKEGDEIVGVAAADPAERSAARMLLANTRIEDIDRHPVLRDTLYDLIMKCLDADAKAKAGRMTLGEFKSFLLERDEAAIKDLARGLSSDVIACVVKLMTNAELIRVGAKVFHPLPESQLGAKGYLGARIQPNSPTDHIEDIRWQVFNGWSYAVGDVVLGTNPVSSDPKSVAAIELALKDLLVTFGIEDILPHCVLSHVDVQAEVEQQQPGSTALWFQSLAGSDSANQTFDVSVEKMLDYAKRRVGRYGFYFETGQGADFTNGHSHGYDMVMHESRKYGFARALKVTLAEVLKNAGQSYQPWLHVNDVAGFIGPEVFRTKEQLVRCCLEDIVMGKLHGLCIGLDVCSTLHMDVSLDDLDWCLDQVMPASPAYLMALPTKIDPMLGYLTTGFQDHVRLREKFGYKVNDRTWRFFQELNVIDAQGKPTEHFGDPTWVYLKYQRKKGDTRGDREILSEGQAQIAAIRSRGVFIAQGRGKNPWDLDPGIDKETRQIYADAKKCIWTEWDPQFFPRIPNALVLATQSSNRTDYILHPETGEKLPKLSEARLIRLRETQAGECDVQIVISDGLNVLALMDEGHLTPFLSRLRESLIHEGYHPAQDNLVVTSGRVRAGYRIGETLFVNRPARSAILHVIGERPGTGHHTFSVYITSALGPTWAQPGMVDHNITKVVSGIAATALSPIEGALETVRILKLIS